MKTINLALQGGGAHGAFAWGVLDRLLEDERLAIEGVSAASAGSVNAVALADGLTRGGRQGAREALEGLWSAVSQSARGGPFQVTALDLFMGNGANPVIAHAMLDAMTRLASPYQFNPLNLNPLHDILVRCIDFEGLRAGCRVKLFLSATNVRTGKIKVFTAHEVTADAVLASTCLPMLFQAVEIDGEAYWDGGYMGNPAIFPLIYECESRDVVIVHINPLRRDEVPRTPAAILDRLNEITFNSSLMREMRAISFVTDLIDNDEIKSRPLRRMLIHAIEAEALMRDLGVASKMSARWSFLKRLRDTGRQTATTWLDSHFDDLGERSTVDIDEVYL